VLAVLLSAAAAPACNVPVFRYALEKWAADPFELTVLHRGRLAPADEALLKDLQGRTKLGLPAANFSLEAVDLTTQPVEQAREVLQQYPKATLPLLVVRYPEACGISWDVWSGRLSAAAVRNLLDSPARREITRRLTSGETAVWLLLESGAKERDEAAARLLGDELRRLEKQLKLPELTADPEDRINDSGPPLKVAFSVLRLSRTDPTEKMLVRMLLHTESDLAGRAAPMVFPVFGRGRVLYALVGAGIKSANIAEAAGYLVGPCTCKLKEQNPGVDLLIAADWDALLSGQRLTDRSLPLTGIPTFAAPAQAAASPGAGESEGEPAERWALLRNLALAVGAGLALVAVATWALWGRGNLRG
jgi:hypothetical protein